MQEFYCWFKKIVKQGFQASLYIHACMLPSSGACVYAKMRRLGLSFYFLKMLENLMLEFSVPGPLCMPGIPSWVPQRLP